ncbi:hypothetical protein EDB84DRAFT_62991 [Lactarius hengduanensis]|nr:hypothetical protein EDB84DRAFT_62991 [Lactarius hengduanensis]
MTLVLGMLVAVLCEDDTVQVTRKEASKGRGSTIGVIGASSTDGMTGAGKEVFNLQQRDVGEGRVCLETASPQRRRWRRGREEQDRGRQIGVWTGLSYCVSVVDVLYVVREPRGSYRSSQTSGRGSSGSTACVGAGCVGAGDCVGEEETG